MPVIASRASNSHTSHAYWSTPMIGSEHLLSDEAMRDFILKGYVRIDTGLPAELFQEAYAQTQTAAGQGHTGDHFLAHTPAIRTVLEHPSVRGTLSSILGPTYRMFSHRHCHHMPPQPKDSGPGWHQMDWYCFHKDTKNPAWHRCRSMMSIMFPHDCAPNRGPTALIPGSQYYTRTTSAYCHDSIQGGGPAGTVILVHYDMWHGGTCNYSDMDRYLMKFVFVRMDEPEEPAWNCKDTTWRPVKQGPSGQQLNDLWECMWNWNCGKPGFSGAAPSNGQRRITNNDIPRLVASLRDEDENVSLQSAYALARLGEPAVEPLLKKLVEEAAAGPDENVNGRVHNKGGKGGLPNQLYYSGYALAAIGSPAAPGLAKLLGHEQWWVRASAADVLREMGKPGRAAAQALARVLSDENDQVRASAAEALGTIGDSSDAVVRALIDRMSDKAEGVRQEAAGALARIRPTPDFAVPTLIKALSDPARYVRGSAVAAMERIGTSEARRAAADFIAARPDEVCLTA